MMIVKITIMLSVIMFIWTKVVRIYYSAHPLDAMVVSKAIDNGKAPVWLIIYRFLLGVDTGLFVLSVIWFLFLR